MPRNSSETGDTRSISATTGASTSPRARRKTSSSANTVSRSIANGTLGEDDELPDDNKRRYRFPYGDFHKVHRCAVLSAESRAGQYKYADIESAAAHLHGMLDALMPADLPASGGARAHSV